MMSGQDFKLVEEDSLKQKLTAENVIGKKVVDRDGETIGKVKDIGLDAAMQHGSASTYGSTSTSGSSSSASSTSPSSTGAGAMTGRPSSMQSPQVNLYVELDNDVGVDGDQLAAIPASSVQFDSTKEQLQLQISRSDLKSKLQSGSSTSSSSTRSSTNN